MKNSLKAQAAIYGLDDATPKELPYVLSTRKWMWRGLKFKLNLIIVLLAANLLAMLSIDIVTGLIAASISIWNWALPFFLDIIANFKSFL
jgi:hypothetical protein